MIGNDIEYAASLLKQGNLVAIPTETVYGLAANALDENAILKIFEVKNRPFFDPLILHTNSLVKVSHFVNEVPSDLMLLAKAFMPGPLTLLLPKKSIVPDLVTSGLQQVAIRIPKHPMALQLLALLDFPLAAPSANPFGYVSPTKPEHVKKQLGSTIPYILDGGVCEIGIESTIVGLEDGVITVYRLGGLTIEAIEEIVGKVNVNINNSSNPTAPGMLKAHYAPRKPLVIDNIDNFILQNQQMKVGVISKSKQYEWELGMTKIISTNADLAEAAHNLFEALRFFDESDVQVIVAEIFPDNFLGRAINDRLRRAAIH